MKPRKAHIILILIIIAGLFLRFFFFSKETFIGTDSVAHSRLGKNIIETGHYSFGENFNFGILYPPVFPIFIGTINLFVHDLFLSGKSISFVSSLLTIFLFYLLGSALHSREAGLYSALFFALYPFVIRTSAYVLSESLFFLFLLLSIYVFIFLIRDHKFSSYILFGVLSGITYLIRPEGFLLLVLPFFFLRKSWLKIDLLKTAVVFLIFIIICSPYLFFLKNSTGKFILNGRTGLVLIKGLTVNTPEHEKIMFSLNEEKTQIISIQEAYKISPLNLILKNPFDFTKKYLKNIVSEEKLLLMLLAPILLPLLFFFFNRNLFKNKIILVVILPSIILFITYPVFLIMPRSAYNIILFMILLSALGTANAPSVINDLANFYDIKMSRTVSFLKKNIKYMIMIVFLLISLLINLYFMFKTSEIPLEHIKAGKFLKSISHEYEEFNIMSRKPWVSFYSESKRTMLPYAPVDDVINFAHLYDVDYIIIDERSLNKWEVYEDFLKMEKYSDDIELVYEDNSIKLIKIMKLKRKNLF